MPSAESEIHISWGQYKDYEGPFYRGTVPLKLKKDPDFLDEAMYVFSRTEGRMDSINMYDSCILSISCAQWCARVNNAYAAVLGMAYDVYGDKKPIEMLAPMLKTSGATFEKVGVDWHFCVNGVPATSPQLLRQLYYLGISGKKGSWTPEARAHAIAWAKVVVLTLREQSMIAAQVDYTKSKMMRFVLNSSKDYLFGVDTKEDDVARCAKAAFLSFAGNNPKWANNSIQRFVAVNKHEKWSPTWLSLLLKELTFGPGIAIYPHRYDAIAPALREVYDVNIPKTSLELRKFVAPVIKEEKEKIDPAPDDKLEEPPSPEVHKSVLPPIIEEKQPLKEAEKSEVIPSSLELVIQEKEKHESLFQTLFRVFIEVLRVVFGSFQRKN